MLELNEKYLKKEWSNPFNYTGSKHRYLKDLFSVLPDAKDLKVLDPFVGGGDLISKLPDSWDITALDKSPQIIELHNLFATASFTSDRVIKLREDRGLTKLSEGEYYKLREEYNRTPSAELLYLLITSSFNNQIRFNRRGEFNLPFGLNRSTFNDRMASKFDNYKGVLVDKKIQFQALTFSQSDFSAYDLLLIDPPYPNTTATYNENGGWSLTDEFELYVKIDKAAKSKTKFVFFSQTWSKGVQNHTLEKWASQYNVRVLADTTKNCSSNRKGGKTVEIMVWN